MPRVFGLVSSMNLAVPTGTMYSFGGSSAPSGFLLCDGSSLSTTTYAALFAAIGYTYGGAGANFSLPDARGKALVAAGTYTDAVSGAITRTVGQVLGAEKHGLATGEMPNHTHAMKNHTHSGTSGNSNQSLDHSHMSVVEGFAGSIGGNSTIANSTMSGATLVSRTSAANTTTTNLTTHTHTVTTGGPSDNTSDPAGSGTTHNNMQPSLVVSAIIKY